MVHTDGEDCQLPSVSPVLPSTSLPPASSLSSITVPSGTSVSSESIPSPSRGSGVWVHYVCAVMPVSVKLLLVGSQNCILYSLWCSSRGRGKYRSVSFHSYCCKVQVIQHAQCTLTLGSFQHWDILFEFFFLTSLNFCHVLSLDFSAGVVLFRREDFPVLLSQQSTFRLSFWQNEISCWGMSVCLHRCLCDGGEGLVQLCL